MTETKKAMCFEASFFSPNHKEHPSFDARNKIRIFSAEWIPTITLTKECPEELLHLKPISRIKPYPWNSEDFLDDIGEGPEELVEDVPEVEY